MTLPSDDRECIAERLRKARESAGLSQGQVAKYLKMHRPTISEIEAGRRRVNTDELGAFASLYEVDIKWLAVGNAQSDVDNSKLILAARELSRLKSEDLDRLMDLFRMLRGTGDPNDGQ